MSETLDQRRSREYYVDMVENRYFGNVDAKNLEGVLECFREDAVFTIQSAFTTHEGRDEGIRRMFETYSPRIVHKGFGHIVDTENGCCSARFEVELVDRDGKELSYSNCNFFYLDEDGRFKRVFVWFSGENVLV